MRHAEIQHILRSSSVGDLLLLDGTFRELGWPRSLVIARVRLPASSSAPARVEFVARLCQTCDEWHATDVADQSIPDVSCAYFAIGPPSVAQRGVVGSDLSVDCVDDDAGSDVEEPRPIEGVIDLDPLFAAAPKAIQGLSVASAFRSVFIFPERPPHIHKVSWAAISASSRAEHVRWLRRLRDAPPDILPLPVARAALEIVLRRARERQWRWSTVASRLSAIKTALRNLPLHSTASSGIDVTSDPAFTSAQSLAQRRARLDAIHPFKSRPISFAEYMQTLRTIAPESAPLLIMSWWFAGRVGDVRRLEPANIDVDLDEVDEKGFVPARALFTRGKGAFFWGPYTIHSRIPVAEAKIVVDRVNAARRSHADTFASPHDQAHLSQTLARLPDSSLRSIRRGALVCFAEAGSTDEQLQLLSGHKHRDVLLRYLGWGVASSEAKTAASQRTLAVADTIFGGEMHPRWMGPHSGFPKNGGRRTSPVPVLFPRKAPKRQDLVGDGSPRHVKLAAKGETLVATIRYGSASLLCSASRPTRLSQLL